MSEELSEIALTLFVGLIMAAVSVAVVLIYRLVRRKPLLPINEDRIKSPLPLYLAIILFGGSSIISFLIGKLYYGSISLLIFLVFVFSLVAYKKGKI